MRVVVVVGVVVGGWGGDGGGGGGGVGGVWVGCGGILSNFLISLNGLAMRATTRWIWYLPPGIYPSWWHLKFMPLIN